MFYKKKIIKGILTERKLINARSFQIVNDWEDILSNKMPLPLYNVKKIYHFFYRNIKRIKLGWLYLIFDSFRPVKSYYLYYNMNASSALNLQSNKNIIPIIIDFWLKKSELKKFYRNHSNCKIVLISSKEVFEFLKENNCPLPIIHFPLSLPDNYASPDIINYKKRIDFLFAGRKDPIFWNYLKQYEKENHDIEYVYQELDGKIPFYISNKRGKLSDDYYSREGYLKLLRESKITFYTTPGLDPAKENANGFNQVTPRFLEQISAGCLVMTRYKNNPDVEYYELNRISNKVDSYEDFKQTLTLFSDKKFSTERKKLYYPYLLKHSTSHSINLLKNILRDNSILN